MRHIHSKTYSHIYECKNACIYTFLLTLIYVGVCMYNVHTYTYIYMYIYILVSCNSSKVLSVPHATALV